MSSAILHRSLSAPMHTAVRGAGNYLFDENGKRYFDASGGAAVSCLGHSNAAVRQAIEEQISQLAYAHTAFFTSYAAEELAEFLMSRSPNGMGKGGVIFASSGSEAVEAALKLARQYHLERGEPDRHLFIARRMGYHGNTVGALSVSGNLARRAPYDQILPPSSLISACYAYREQRAAETEHEYGQRIANELEAEIVRLGASNVAAFIAEPVVGATRGCVPAVPGYLTRIQDICEKYGVLFIADEVMCGAGRTGKLFAISEDAATPDIITMSKGLGGGFQPISALIASEKITAALKQGSGRLENGHTYMGHATACAAALAVQQYIESNQLLENVIARGAEFQALLHDRFDQHPNFGDIRGRGLFVGVEFVDDKRTKQPLDRGLKTAERLKQSTFEAGLLCYPGSGTADGICGDHVLFAPAFTVTSNDLAEIVDRFAIAIKAVLPA